MINVSLTDDEQFEIGWALRQSIFNDADLIRRRLSDKNSSVLSITAKGLKNQIKAYNKIWPGSDIPGVTVPFNKS